MGIGDVARSIAPAAGLLVGAAALGAVASYGAITVAGETDEDAGMGRQLLGNLGGMSLVSGMFSGMAAWQVASRIGGGTSLPGPLEILAMPAGIGGAMLGGAVARAGLERRHQAEYDAQLQKIDDTMVATTAALRDAGAGEAVLARVPESYDRSYFNASYRPPLGPFRNEIVIGRHPGSGLPFAADDVIAHEFTHKVLHAYSPQLLTPIGGGDGRAIHESVADTIAMVVDREDWLIGEDAVEGGIRSFSHPELRGAYRDGEAKAAPITREQLESSTEEHLGAGVGNKAAWRIGNALGRDTMARIYVAGLERRELPRGATYADLAQVVRAASVDLYGARSHEARVVDDAWAKAGY